MKHGRPATFIFPIVIKTLCARYQSIFCERDMRTNFRERKFLKKKEINFEKKMLFRVYL